jgi:hypothetical protein
MAVMARAPAAILAEIMEAMIQEVVVPVEVVALAEAAPAASAHKCSYSLNALPD